MNSLPWTFKRNVKVSFLFCFSGKRYFDFFILIHFLSENKYRAAYITLPGAPYKAFVTNGWFSWKLTDLPMELLLKQVLCKRSPSSHCPLWSPLDGPGPLRVMDIQMQHPSTTCFPQGNLEAGIKPHSNINSNKATNSD